MDRTTRIWWSYVLFAIAKSEHDVNNRNKTFPTNQIPTVCLESNVSFNNSSGCMLLTHEAFDDFTQKFHINHLTLTRVQLTIGGRKKTPMIIISSIKDKLVFDWIEFRLISSGGNEAYALHPHLGSYSIDKQTYLSVKSNDWAHQLRKFWKFQGPRRRRRAYRRRPAGTWPYRFTSSANEPYRRRGRTILMRIALLKTHFLAADDVQSPLLESREMRQNY